MDVNLPFREHLVITKAYEKDGQYYLEAESSGPEVDKDEQFMTKECIEGMAAQIEAGPVPYRDGHKNTTIQADLGMVIGAQVGKDYHLQTKTLLDWDNSAARLLWKKVKKEGKQFGQSVAGRALALAKKTVGGKVLKGFAKIHLDHIANTTKPSWHFGIGTMIAKSQDWGDLDWDDVPEYDEDIPDWGDVAKKATPSKKTSAVKPDPEAGKGYVVVDSLKKLLALLEKFGWKSYQDKVDERNRDKIALDAPPTGDLFPVGSLKPPTKSIHEGPDEWVGWVEKAQPVEGDPSSMADTYLRLYHVAKAISGEEDKTLLGHTMAAMAALNDILTASKEEAPKPLMYGVEGEVSKEAVEELVAALEKEEEQEGDVGALQAYVEGSGKSVLRSFAQADEQPPANLQRVSKQQQAPKPPGVLSDFSQVGEEPPHSHLSGGLGTTNFFQVGEELPSVPPVEKEEVTGDLAAFQRFIDEVKASGAPVEKQQEALMEAGGEMLKRMANGLEDAGDRVAKEVAKAVGPLQARIAQLEKQLAVAKTSERGSEDEPAGGGAVRKSIRPSRSVAGRGGSGKPTFTGLVRGNQYGEDSDGR